MKRILCLLFFLLPLFGRGFGAFGPQSPETISLRERCDSILADADRLYWYEAAAWITGDLAAQRALVSDGYCSYGKGDSTCSMVFRGDRVLLFTVFIDGACYVDTLSRPMSPWERRFTDMRAKLIGTVCGGSYPIRTYEGYDLNFVLVEQDPGYKLYLMMGTRYPGVIPLGNDYVFFADSHGRITGWRQLHKSLLATDSGDEEIRRRFIDGQVRAVMHSHSASEPLITSTDICQMRLYGPMYGVDTLKVYSPSLETYFVYTVGANEITLVPAGKSSPAIFSGTPSRRFPWPSLH